MHIIASTLLVSLALLVEGVTAMGGRHGSPSWKRTPHRGHGVDEPAVNVTSRELEKRFDGARFTFYDAGLGACGKVNSNSEFVVAMNAGQFAGGAHCFETITITVNGKSTQAQVVDLCPVCPFAGLDFSRGLFNFYANEGAGVLSGSWVFGAGAPAPPPPAPKPVAPTPTPPPPSKTPTPTPSSTVPPPSTSHSTSHSSSPSASPSASSTASVAPVPTPVGNLQQFNLAFIQMGSIALASPEFESPPA
ncbi:hypothetical protein B0H34DRAFT_693468 [Crassisporium funariophilum]|nr:hypothetical protein B0H34DRAFT_693468 [Crassisporium funariophilum]